MRGGRQKKKKKALVRRGKRTLPQPKDALPLLLARPTRARVLAEVDKTLEGSHDLLELVLTLLKVVLLLNFRVLTRERGVVLGINKTSM